jgi:predicted nucleic acid-binding protein
VTNKKVLVDTSAWIVSFRSVGLEGLKTFLRDVLERDQVVTTPLIILELLQGCKTQREFSDLKARMESLENVLLEDLSWDRVYHLAFSLRRKGLTLPTLDILIAFLSIRKGYALLHHDRHFRLIAEHSELAAIDFLG